MTMTNDLHARTIPAPSFAKSAILRAQTTREIGIMDQLLCSVLTCRKEMRKCEKKRILQKAVYKTARCGVRPMGSVKRESAHAAPGGKHAACRNVQDFANFSRIINFLDELSQGHMIRGTM